jgi:hypothetical protein
MPIELLFKRLPATATSTAQASPELCDQVAELVAGVVLGMRQQLLQHDTTA